MKKKKEKKYILTPKGAMTRNDGTGFVYDDVILTMIRYKVNGMVLVDGHLEWVNLKKVK